MAEQSNTPQLKFQGYTDAWGQVKLGDIADRITRKNANLESNLPLTISAQYGLIDQNEFFDKRIASKDISGYYLLRKGEYAYNKSTSNDAPWGAVKRLEKYDKGVVSTLYIVFSLRSNIDSDYFATYYSTDLWHRGIQEIASEGARNHGLLNIAPNDFFNTAIKAPKSLDEQKKIGSFFQSLDAMVALHRRKREKLQEIKKSLLQKMFPAEGEDRPQIRFAGYTDAWGQVKLGDIADRITRKNANLESNLPLTISAQYGLIDQNEFFDKRIASKDISGYYLLRKGEYAYNKSTSNDAPWGAVKRLEKYDKGVVSTLYIVFSLRSNIDSDYFATYYSTDLWHRGIQEIASEGARNHGLLNIAPNDFFNTAIKAPKSLDEQKKIGSFFQSLDAMVALHQRKLYKLQEIKKALLQKMFC